MTGLAEKAARPGARIGRFVAAAFLAACLYALSTPCSKVLLGSVAPNMMAALLYLGAGVGMAALTAVRAAVRRAPAAEEPLERADAPYAVAMVLLDIAAPILLMAGLAHAAPENVALLNNFEIVATAVIAFAAFRERVAPRTWAGIAVITASCALLSLEGAGALSFSAGSLLVLGACLCWGVENNCTSRLSQKDPAQVVVVKGLGSGTGALAVALLAGDALPALPDVHRGGAVAGAVPDGAGAGVSRCAGAHGAGGMAGDPAGRIAGRLQSLLVAKTSTASPLSARRE